MSERGGLIRGHDTFKASSSMSTHPLASVEGGESRQALIIVSPWVYHEECGIGGGVLCFRALRELAKSFDVHFISFDATSHGVEAGKSALAELCMSTTFVPVPHRPPTWIRLWRLFVSGRPVLVQMSYSVQMAERIADAVVELAPAAVILQYPEMAQYRRCVPARCRALIDTLDVTSVSRFREWRAARTILGRLRAAIVWIAWVRYEFSSYRHGDALIAISESDLGVLRSFLPQVPSLLSHPAVDLRPPARAPRGRTGLLRRKLRSFT